MRKLVIDAGNTRIKAALFEADHLHSLKVFDPLLSEEFVAWWQAFEPQSVLVSDVGGKALESIRPYLPALPILELSTQLKLPFDNNYASKQTLGSDRMALVAGAMHFFSGHNCLCIDAGTCVTYDLVGADKTYWGGNITPGLSMRLKAMHTFTGKLPLPEFHMPSEVLGTDTESCLLTGAYYGLIGEINHFISHYSANNSDLKILLSGGDAQTLAKSLKSGIFVHEHLLLYGLNKIVEING